MAILMPPDYRLLKEPRLLISRRLPVRRVRIDPGHWLANDIKFCGIVRDSDRLFNIADSAAGDFYGLSSAGNAALYGGSNGLGLRFSPSSTAPSAKATIPSQELWTKAYTNGITVIVHLRYTGSQINGPQMLFSFGGTTNGFGLRFNISPDVFAYYSISDSGADLNNAAGSITYTTDEVDVVIAMSTRADGTFASYHNGALDLSASGLGVIGAHSGQPLLIGSNILANSNSWEGAFYSFMVIDRGCSDDELKTLSIDPYQLLIPA